MPVTERLQAMGQWSLTLRPDTPKTVRDALAAPYQSIVITPSWVDVAGMTDAAVLDAAIYNGVILRPGPQYELGGVGLVWWLGDEKGVPYLASPVSSSGQSLSSWVTALLANANAVDSVGSVTGGGPVGGNIGAKAATRALKDLAGSPTTAIAPNASTQVVGPGAPVAPPDTDLGIPPPPDPNRPFRPPGGANE